MAKADDASSTMIWLRDALELAVGALGSKTLAQEQLKEWLAAGVLPWSYRSWKGIDAEDLAKLRERKKTFRGILSIPSAAYYPGDPRFWGARLIIDWEDNGARDPAGHGAQALGIRVSRTQLLSLLPEEPREREEALPQTKPAKRKSMEPKAWLAEVRKENPRLRNEKPTAYARRLHALMLMPTADVTRVWSVTTLRRRLYDK